MDADINLLTKRLEDLETSCEKSEWKSMAKNAVLIRFSKRKVEKLLKDTPALRPTYQDLLDRAEEAYDLTQDLMSTMKVNQEAQPSTSSTPVKTQVNFHWETTPFFGKPTDWSEWWDIFKSSVHENKDLDLHTKVRLLNSCLKDQAREVLGKLAFTAENYEAAILKLKSRYASADALSRAYYTELESMKPADSLKSHRQVLDKLQAIVRNLESTEINIPLDNQRIADQILSKFPLDVARLTLFAIKTSKPDLILSPADILSGLEEVMQVDDYLTRHWRPKTTESTKIEGILTIGQSRPLSPQEQSENSTTQKSASRPFQKSTQVRGRESRSCLFCGKGHRSHECWTYATISRRRQKLVSLKRCLNCIRNNHETAKCRSPAAKCSKRGRSHNLVLCVVRTDNTKRRRGKNIYISNTFLQTFICTILGDDSTTLTVRGIMDTASTSSYIHNDIVKKLGLCLGKYISLEYLRFREEQSITMPSREVLITIKNEENVTRSLRLLTADCIVGNLLTSPPVTVVHKLLPPEFRYADYDIFLDQQRPIHLLIGIDLYFELVYTQSVHELPSGLHLLNSFFGWIPSGGTRTNVKDLCDAETIKSSLLLPNINTENPTFDTSKLELLWSLESLGIEHPSVHKSSDSAIEHFRETAYIQPDGRVNVSFPWKNTNVSLPSNFRITLARLQALLKKWPTDVLQKGHEHFQTQLKEKIIEIAPPKLHKEPVSQTNTISFIHYLPHTWLFQKNKLRVVYDPSTKTKNGICLNDLIHQGPKLTENLVKLLLNFRLYAVGLTADIERAYLQLALNKADRNAVRFLWLKNPLKAATSDNLCHLRLTRVPFGVNASPFLLNVVLQEILAKPPIDDWLLSCKHNFYVDNFLMSVPNSVDALQIHEILTKRLNSIKMNLRDWVTNDQTIQNTINTSNSVRETSISVLGLLWDTNTDNLSFKKPEHITDTGTKRNMLKTLASIFDPLGLVAPCVLPLKLLIQKCWKNKYQWDTPLPHHEHEKWFKIYNELFPIWDIILPRRYWLLNEVGDYHLHIFCDASKNAYACCAYLVYKNETTGKKASQLIFTKAKITPVRMAKQVPVESETNCLIKAVDPVTSKRFMQDTQKPSKKACISNTSHIKNNSADNLTIPKLELLAVLIGTRTANFLQQNLSIPLKQIVLWTDATTVLQWLHSTEILQTFIKNRIVEIKQCTNVCIKYVPTSDNPADLASRGKPVAAIMHNSLWWTGPTWLLFNELWPQPPQNVQNYDSNRQVVSLLLTGKPKPSFILNTSIETKNCWRKQVRIMRNLFLFYFRCKKQLLSNLELMQLGEKALIKGVQQKHCEKAYITLKQGHKNDLDLFLDDEKLIRCKGRLHYAGFPWETTHPILLPRSSRVTFNYIKYVHERNMHIGTSHTLAKVREKFWVPKGRAAVRSVIHKCYFCKYWEGGSYQLPPIPPLPEVRLRDSAPFLQTGVDYFGPLQVKDVHAGPHDCYVLIFACLVTRAVHLELVPDLSGEHFLMALQRMCSLRFIPKFIISDNAKTFTFIQPLLGSKVSIGNHKINEFLNSNYIEWHFIPQYAPWFGGAYERLIGIVKRCLKKSYGRTLLTYIEFHTVLYQVADIINSRPLTYVSEENIEPITPNHLLKVHSTNLNLQLEPTIKPIVSDTGEKLLKHWELRKTVLDEYWNAFRNLYLLSLRERHVANHPSKKGSVAKIPTVGDVVLIEEQGLPRANWKMGRIEKLDSRQAVAHVRQVKSLLIRSIRQLYPLLTTTLL